MSGLMVRHRLPSGHEGWLVKCEAELLRECSGQFFTQSDRQDICPHCGPEMVKRLKEMETKKSTDAFTLDDHPVTGAMDVFNEKERWQFGMIAPWI